MKYIMTYFMFVAVIIGLAVTSAFAEPIGALNPNVTQRNIDSTICLSGYTKTIRPSSSYTSKVKRKLIGIDGDMSKYELDHFVPLSIGGSPKSIDNLWAQSWDGTCNAKDKDRLEKALQQSVCYGVISLKEAQDSIVKTNWRTTYREYFGKAC